ncbi:MAG: tetratricopeptide repeat protein [Prevotella sp.]|nr:tetratricopeptide repeat protein [Prevotella sp.]
MVAKSKRTPLSHNDAQRLKYFYYGAINEQMQGRYTSAYEMLRHCLTIDPNSPEVYFTISAYYAELDQDSMALECMKRAADIDPTNSTYMERLAQAHLSNNNVAEATKVYEKLYATDRSRTDLLETLLRLYTYQEDIPNIMQTLDRIEAAEGSSEQISMARMRIYEQQGEKKKALAELKHLAEEHPLDMNYRVMIGNWLLQNGKSYEALQEYNKVLEADPGNQQVRMSLLDYYRAVGKDSIADRMQEQLLAHTATPASTKMQLMRDIVSKNEQSGGDSTQVLDLFSRILAEPQENADMYQLKAAYMQLKEMPQDSIDNVLRQALKIEPDEASVRFQLVGSTWEKGDYDEVINLCKPAVEYNPDEMLFYYYMGMAYYVQKKNDEALETFRQGASQIDEDSNKDLASDFYAIMGDILHERGRNEEAFAAYDSSLHWKSDNISCLNNYAYYLSIEERELSKAEQMSYRTVKAEPKNSTYLDTYAWILFIEERYEEARIYIEQALLNLDEEGGVIYEHAGDIFAMNGDTEKALEYWLKAREDEVESKTLDKKIKQRKYIKEPKK